MEYKAKPSGRPADFYIIGLVLAGGIFWSLTNFQKSFTALYQLISIVMLSAAVYLLIRYRLTVFRLRIEGKNGIATDIQTAMPEELDFVAERMRGKGAVALARLSLSELKRAEVVKYEELRVKTDGVSLYRYQADMSPEEGILLVFASGEGDVAIFADMSTEMFVFLRKIADRNLSASAD